MSRGSAWLDIGTFDSLIDAAFYVEAIEDRQGQSVACIEEIAYNMGYIDRAGLEKLVEPMQKSIYGQNILKILAAE